MRATRLRVTRLEPRRVLNASPLFPVQDPGIGASDSGAPPVDGSGYDGVAIDAGAAADDGVADTFHIYRSGEGVGISVNGTEIFNGLLDDQGPLTILGSGDQDHLIVDVGPDGLPAADIRFEAGSQPIGTADLLELRGSTGSITHSLLSAGDGITFTEGTSLAFDDVEQLHDAVNAAIRSVRLGEIDTATISESATGGLTLETDGLRLDLARPGEQLLIDLEGGSGTQFDVAGLGSDLTFDVTIDGDAADRIAFDGNTTFASGDLDAEAGVIELNGSIHSDGGRLEFTSSTELTVGEDAHLASTGGEIELNAGDEGRLTVGGTIDVSDDSPTGHGGEVRLLGNEVWLIDSAEIDASGTLGGGTILIGGDYQGSNADVLNSVRTSVSSGVTIRADAIESGDGGRIIIWSDVATAFAGAVLARGGQQGGNGGFVEISGKESLYSRGHYDLSAAAGAIGTLLFDPANIRIRAGENDGDDTGDEENDLDPSTIGFDDAIVNFDIFESEIEGTAANIILQARNSIVVLNANAFDDGLTLQNDASLILRTRNATGEGSGGINLEDLTITVSGVGQIVLRTAYNEGAGNEDGGGDAGTASIVTGNLITAGGNITLVSEGNVTIDGTLGAGTGNVSITAGGAIIDGSGNDDAVNIAGTQAILNAGSTIGGAGNADLDLQINQLTVTAGGNVVLSDSGDTAILSVTTGGGNFTIVSGAAISIADAIDAGAGTVNLTAGTTIIDASADEDALIIASRANLVAGTAASNVGGIGNAGALDIDLQVNQVSAVTDFGHIVLQDNSGLEIVGDGIAITDDEAGNDISVTVSAGPLTVNAEIENAGSGQIVLGAAGTLATDDLTINNAITAGGNIILGAGGDIIQGNSGLAATVSTTGSGDVTYTTGRSIVIGPDGRILTAAGDVSLTNNALFDENYIGIELIGSATGGFIATATGSITVTGQGGTGGNGNIGVQLRDGGRINSSGAAGDGPVTVTGTAGSGVDGNVGVVVTGTAGIVASRIGSDDGDVVVVVNGTGAGSGEGNVGVLVSAGGLITTTDDGTVTVTGVAGAGTNDNVGVLVTGAGSGIRSVDGDLTIDGTGNGSGTGNSGVSVVSSDEIRSIDGDVTVTGVASSSGTDANVGVFVSDASIETQNGLVTVDGTGGGSGTGNDGVLVTATGRILGTENGSVDVTGTAADGTGQNVGVRLATAGDRIASQDGSVTVTGTGGDGGSQNYGIVVAGGQINKTDTGSGTVTVEGTGGNGTTENHGIYVTGVGALINSATGLSIEGTANGNGSNNVGVLVENGGGITKGGNVAGTITGTGSTDGVDGNVGIIVTGATSHIASSAGTLNVNGTGGGSGTANDGVFVAAAGVIEGTTSGGLSVIGTAAAGTGDNVGIRLENDSSRVSTVNGALNVTGTGGNGGSGNYGVSITDAAVVQSTGSGSVTVTGTAGTGTGDNVGLLVLDAGSRIGSTSGVLTASGTGRGSGTGNFGVVVEVPAEIETTSGNLFVEGTGAGGADGVLLVGNNNPAAPVAQVQSTSGDISVRALVGNLNMDQAAAVHSQSGDILLGSSNANVLLSRVNANSDGNASAGAVTINAGGQIIDNLNDAGDVAANVIGSGLTATAGSGIGNFDPTVIGFEDLDIDVQVDNLAATTATGDIFIVDPSGLTITGTGVAITTGGAGNDVLIIAESGTLTVDETVRNNGSGLITLTAAGVTASDDLVVNGNITAAGGGDIDLDAGGDILQGDSAAVSSTASGEINYLSGRTIALSDDATIVSAAGTILLTNQHLFAGNYVGINLNDARITTSTGIVTITGTGGTGGNANVGVRLQNGGQINSTGGAGASQITVTGFAGAGTNTNIGVVVTGPNSLISAVSGNVVVTGTAAGTGTSNDGLVVSNGGAIATTGSAALTVEGVAADGTGSNMGVRVSGASSRIATVNGELDVDGTGGNGGSSNYGIAAIDGGAIRSTGSGVVILVGQAGTGTDDNVGVVSNGDNSLIAAANGSLTVTGVGGGTGDGNIGIRVDQGGTIATTGSASGFVLGVAAAGVNENAGILVEGEDAVISTAGGTLTVFGIGAGTGTQNDGIRINDDGGIQATGAGNLSINGFASAGTGDNVGVRVTGNGSTISAVNGTATVTADGGDGGTLNFGLLVADSAIITVTGSGTIDIDATAGTGTTENDGVRVMTGGTISGLATSSIDILGIASNGTGDNVGVRIIGDDVEVSALNGSLRIEGRGGAGGDFNHGILVTDDATVQLTGSGTATLVGIAGAGVDNNVGVLVTGADSAVTSSGQLAVTGTSNGTGSANDGIRVTAGAEIAANGSGTANLNGTGANGAGDNLGVRLTGADSRIGNQNGALSVIGRGGTGGDVNHGVLVDLGASIDATGNGAINVSGIAGSVVTQAVGVVVRGNSTIETLGGAMTVAGTGTTGDGVLISGAGSSLQSTTGAINVIASSNDLALRNGAQILTNSGNVSLTATRHVILGRVDANADDAGLLGNVTITADSDSDAVGAIFDITAAEGSGGENIIAGTLQMFAATGIGNGTGVFDEAADIDVAVTGAITAGNTAAGSIQIFAIGNANLATLTNPGRTIVIDAALAITDGTPTDPAGSVNIAGGTALLRATAGIGSPGIGDLDTAVDGLAAINTIFGDIGISDVDDVTYSQLSQVRAGDPLAGDIVLVAGGLIIGGGTGATIDGTGSITLRSTGTAGTSGIILVAQTRTGLLTADDGTILLQADDVAIAAAVNAGNSVVQITPHTNNGSITLGGAGGLSLTAGELNLVTARVLTIGGFGVAGASIVPMSSAGVITIAGPVLPASAQIVVLLGSNVFGAAGGSVGAGGTLIIDTVAGVSGVTGSLVTNTTNLVGQVRGAGDFRVTNTGSLTLVSAPAGPFVAAGQGPPIGLTGVSTPNGAIAVSTGNGTLTLVSGVNSTGSTTLVAGGIGNVVLQNNVVATGNVLIVAGGQLIQSAGRHITAPTAALRANGSVGSAANPIEVHVSTVAALAGGHVYLNKDTATPLTIGTIAGTIGVQAGGIAQVTTNVAALTVNSLVRGNAVRLAAHTDGVAPALPAMAESGESFDAAATQPRADLTLNATVDAATVAMLEATQGAIQQASAAVYVKGGSTGFIARDAVGLRNAPIDLLAGIVAARSSTSGVYLNQDAGGGNLTVGAVSWIAAPSVSVEGLNAAATFTKLGTAGNPLSQVSVHPALASASNIVITTENSDLILAHRVIGNNITLTANRAATFGETIFAGGYIETPTARVVGRLSVALSIEEVRLDASLSTVFFVRAGTVANTVDGLLFDRNLTVTVDFGQPEGGGFIADFPRIQSQSDVDGSRVRASGFGFGPFQFTYDDFFLFQKSLEAGPRENLFDIIVTAEQARLGDNAHSIEIIESLNGQTRIVTRTTTAGTTVESTPPNIVQTPIALLLQVPVTPPFELPDQIPPSRIFEPPAAPAPAAVPSESQPDDPDLIDLTAASSGVVATDKPQLYLVWRLPGLEDQTGRKQFPIVVLSPQYLRALAAELPQGRYWFELQEPGGDPYTIGEPFYIRGGRIDADVPPEDLGMQTPDLGEDVAEAAFDGADALDGADAIGGDDGQVAAGEFAAGAVGLAGIGLLRGRWRRRFESCDGAVAPSLTRSARLSRRIRKLAR